ncbi:hypothetical protein BC827DRAFT_99706 [Russula dissimulans]|nr:hypothetical protein BC827DRAFT_99706 [Russula dissimulans]
MVSFQCDTCTDVVKKPKLDRHYGQCRSSFTCIDCSKTFRGPAEWKAHTSCITEAEKYQKSLYKGPKKGQNPSNGHQKNSQTATVNATGKKPDLVADHISNGSETKEKKRKKKHDPPREQNGKDATDPVIEPPKKKSSDMKRSSEKQKTDVSQPPTESGDKKVKKRKKEEVRLKQGDVNEPATSREDDKEGKRVDEDEKRKKKRKLR